MIDGRNGLEKQGDNPFRWISDLGWTGKKSNYYDWIWNSSASTLAFIFINHLKTTTMKKISKILFFIAALTTLIFSCRKDESDDSTNNGNTGGNYVQVIISGIVLDENNQPVSNASVTSGNLSTVTNQYGLFLLQGEVSRDRSLISIQKAGYLSRLHALIPKSNTINYVKIVLSGEPAAQLLASSAGGTVQAGNGGSVQFAPNSFVVAGSNTPYSGTVNIVTKHLDINDTYFGLMIPGGDLAGKNSSGENVSLYSYGMTAAILSGSSGENLELAPGSSATITFPLATSQQADAPATIPLWYLDETTGLWMEDGLATKVGNSYVGTVTHFTWWNCDHPGAQATISGLVTDCEGVPLANVTVTVNSGMTVVTDQNGYYSNWVPSGITLTFQVHAQGTFLLPSQLENVGPLSSGQVFTVPTLVVPCGSRVYGQITNCDGNLTEGSVIITSNNVILNSIHTINGMFSLMTPANETCILYSYSSSGTINMQINCGSAGDSIDAGTIQLCNSSNSSQGFNITGNGYNGETVTLITTVTSSDAYWSLSTGYTIGTFTGNSSAGPCTIYLTYQGASEGIHNISANYTLGNFLLNLNGTTYYSSSYTTIPFILELTYYGPVDDSIRGTFYGGLSTDSITEVMISNGRFSFPRSADHN